MADSAFDLSPSEQKLREKAWAYADARALVDDAVSGAVDELDSAGLLVFSGSDWKQDRADLIKSMTDAAMREALKSRYARIPQDFDLYIDFPEGMV